MNRDLLFVFIVFILVIAGIYLAFFNKATLSNDASFNILNNLNSQVKIGFSNIEARTFIWNIEEEGKETSSQSIAGKGFTAAGVSNKEIEAVKGYFEDNGFKIDFFDIDQKTLSGISGYKKGSDVCVVTTTIWKDDKGMPMATDKFDADVSCGQLED